MTQTIPTALDRGHAAQARTAVSLTRHREWHRDSAAIARLVVHLAKADPMLGDGNDRRPLGQKSAHNEFDRAVAILACPWRWNEDYDAMISEEARSAERRALEFARGDSADSYDDFNETVMP